MSIRHFLALFALSTLTAGAAEAAPSSASLCRVTLYQHSNFGGTSQVLGIGSTDMNGLSGGNDQVSSVKVSSGCTAYLYEHAGFQGRVLKITSDTSWVGDSWNDVVSSVKVVSNMPSIPRNDTGRQEAACWEPAYVACLATTDGGLRGAQGCYGNYVQCMTGGAAPVGCFKAAFTDCVSTTSGSDSGVQGCHGNYLHCVDRDY